MSVVISRDWLHRPRDHSKRIQCALRESSPCRITLPFVGHRHPNRHLITRPEWLRLCLPTAFASVPLLSRELLLTFGRFEHDSRPRCDPNSLPISSQLSRPGAVEKLDSFGRSRDECGLLDRFELLQIHLDGFGL